MRTIRCRKRKIIAAVLLVILLLVFVGGLLYYRHTERQAAVSITATSDTDTVQAVFFRQKDSRWKDNALGDSAYHMGDSGCLTCCCAAAMRMQGILPESLPNDATAGDVNTFFSENGIYDGEGNLQWDRLEQVTGIAVAQQDAASLAENALDDCLKSGIYPIVRVKMLDSGSWHFVLLAGSRDGEYYCMDPLHETEETVPLSEFGGEIYAVRWLEQ